MQGLNSRKKGYEKGGRCLAGGELNTRDVIFLEWRVFCLVSEK